MPEKIFSEGVLLPDGRKARVLAYDDGSVRLRLDGAPYALSEAFLQGGTNDHAIIKLSPVAAPASFEPIPTGFACPHEGCQVVAKTANGLQKHVAAFHSIEAHARMLGVPLDEDDGDEEAS
jgi:hypothetical protein